MPQETLGRGDDEEISEGEMMYYVVYPHKYHIATDMLILMCMLYVVQIMLCNLCGKRDLDLRT